MALTEKATNHKYHNFVSQMPEKVQINFQRNQQKKTTMLILYKGFGNGGPHTGLQDTTNCHVLPFC